MTIGAAFYNPNGRFAGPRSFYKGFTIEVTVTSPIVQTVNMFRFVNSSNPNQRFTVVIDPRFWAWSSNAWTLDHVITESYYQNLPNVTEIPMSFALSYFIYPPGKAPYLNFQPFQLNFPNKHPFTFPGAPVNYWRPPFPS